MNDFFKNKMPKTQHCSASIVFAQFPIDQVHGFEYTALLERSITSVVKRIAVDSRDLEFDSVSSQIGRSVAIDSPPLRCFFRAVLPRR